MVIVSRSEVRKIKGIERIIKQSFEQKDIPSGEEICQVQLFHLANSIKDTTINTEIDKFLPQLEEILKDSSKEELIKKFFSVEFTRFFNYYKNSSDLNSKAKNDNFSDDGDSTRYFINIGSKDGFDWMSLKDFLKEHLDLGRDGVSRVDVKDSFSFFNTETAEKDKVLAAFENYQHEGRNVNVEETKSQGGGGGRNRKGRSGGSGGRRNNNFKRNSGSSDGGRRSSSRRGGSDSSGGGRRSNIKSSVNRRKSRNS